MRKQALEIPAKGNQYTTARTDELLKSVEDLKDYPDAAAYPPMKDTLIGVLSKSPDPKARHMAAVTLGNGFGDDTEIESAGRKSSRTSWFTAVDDAASKRCAPFIELILPADRDAARNIIEYKQYISYRYK